MKNVLQIFTAALIIMSGCSDGKDQKMQQSRINAPEFPPGLEWLNTDEPLSIKDLEGKFVLLDFWTYCCINCIHIIPDLKKLEEKYDRELVVIGVHSAKFLTEKGTENIRQAVLRYEIEHPVVNDKDFEIWQSYGARAWPTIVLIAPDGKIVGQMSGEGIFKPVDNTLSELIPEYKDILDTTEIKFALENNKKKKTLLNFPGKITADNENGLLYITDSNNDRIIITDTAGNVKDVIGSGSRGTSDGSFDEAEFNQPQGTALKNGWLYIADTENHLIRKADLEKRTVVTISGTGEQVYQRDPRGKAVNAGLNSPWDLTVLGDQLYIAMAGPHQLWAIDLNSGDIRLHAGSGAENIIDGALKSAQLAQPSGITHNGATLFFADSEVSGIRSADTSSSGGVETIIGEGLFEFGDIDDSYPKARLQHPLGIVAVKDVLYVADTYNNKIKIVDPAKKTSFTYAGSGEEGKLDGSLEDAQFDEPGGIDYANGKLYISDTNNHLIRVIDMEAGTVSTLQLKGLEKLRNEKRITENFRNAEVIESPPPANLEQIALNINFDDGVKFNNSAPSVIIIYDESGSVLSKEELKTEKNVVRTGELKTEGDILIETVVYYCTEENESLCYVSDKYYKLSGSSDENTTEITIKLSAK